MTIHEAIEKIDSLNPNQYSEEVMLTWLSNLDAIIYNDVVMRHHPLPENPFMPYTMDDIDNQLLVEAPYDELYIAYINMKIDEANQETARYNNSVAIFDARYREFTKYYNRTFKPVNEAKFRLW